MPKPNYSPPPPTLDYLNPIQRYMQKGELDRQDYIRLAALVLAYWFIRPYLHKAAKWWFGSGKVEEGEKAQEEYKKRRLAKIGANAIRSGKKEGSTVIEQMKEEDEVVASGHTAENTDGLVSRKSKPQVGSKKSAEDELLDWEDEPARQPTEGDKADVVEWLKKWDK